MAGPSSWLARRGPSALLGLAMGVSNVMSYLFVALLSSSLGPADFGGFSALNTYGLYLAMPAGALQLVVARRQSASARAAGTDTDGLRIAAVVGLTLFGLTCVLAPVLQRGFHLESAWAAVWLGAMLPPMTLTGAQQGILLGQERLARLSVLYLVTAVTRVLAAAVAVVADLGVTQVFAATFVASMITLLAGAALVRGLTLSTALQRPLTMLADLVRSNASLAALMALSSVDVILARHYLTQHDSGAYSLGALFGRVVFWGTQFVALSIIPAVADAEDGRDRRQTLRTAGVVVSLLGVTVALVCAAVPHLLVSLTGGSEYASAEPLLVWFAVVGTAWALIQLWLFADLSSGRHLIGVLAAVATAAEVVLVVVWWHDTPGQVLAVTGVMAGLVAVAGAMLLPRGATTPAPTAPETVEALHSTSD